MSSRVLVYKVEWHANLRNIPKVEPSSESGTFCVAVDERHVYYHPMTQYESIIQGDPTSFEP